MTPRQLAYAIHTWWEPEHESLEEFVARCFARARTDVVTGALAILADRMVAAELAREETA